MYRKRFQGFKSLEAYRESSKTNNDLHPDNQWKQSVSTKFIAFLAYTEFSGSSTISIYTDHYLQLSAFSYCLQNLHADSSKFDVMVITLRPCSLFKASRLFDNYLRVLHAISDKYETAVNASLDQIQNFFELDICSLSWKFHRKSFAEFSTFRSIFYFRPICTCNLSIYS